MDVCSLVSELDKKLLCLLNDGRTYIGFLRSVDEANNMVFTQTIERQFAGKLYGDVKVGTYIIPFDSIMLLGELDNFKEQFSPLTKVSEYTILMARHKEYAAEKEKKENLAAILKERGSSYKFNKSDSD